MNKTEINDSLRKYVQESLSPTVKERDFIGKIYESVQAVLGADNCRQIGSYPRFTATTPVHDLDVLYRIGPWPGHVPNPASTLGELKTKIERDFKNPTDFPIRVERQTHSITIVFLDDEETVFAVDIVPGYKIGTNEFKQDTFMVPEIAIRRYALRRTLYDELARSGRAMSWVKSDPLGYIEVAKLVNEKNSDFRKSAKLAKAWKWSCKEQNDSFKLKSFHIEQVITEAFRSNVELSIYDAVVQFLRNLSNMIQRPAVVDRADSMKFIDEYVATLTQEEKQTILQAGNSFLNKLENVASEADVANLLVDTAKRATKARIGRRPVLAQSASAAFIPKSPWSR